MSKFIFLSIVFISQFSYAELNCKIDKGCVCTGQSCLNLDPDVINEVSVLMVESLTDEKEAEKMMSDIYKRYGCKTRISDYRGGFGMLMSECLIKESKEQCPGGRGEKFSRYFVCKKDSAIKKEAITEKPKPAQIQK